MSQPLEKKPPVKKKKISMLTLILLCVLGYVICSRFGWVFWSGSFDPTPERRAQLEPLATELKNTVVMLTDKIGDRNAISNYQALQAAADYIISQLRAYGYDPQLHEFAARNKTVRNIIASREGASASDEIIIVGAHYDTCFNPGADDNASGVAATLALAGRFANRSCPRWASTSTSGWTRATR